MIYSIGEILVDIFKSEQESKVFPGGAPFNVACNINHFGGDVHFVGAVGDDEYGKFLKKFARTKKLKGLTIQTLKTRSTSQAIVTLTNGERNFKFVREFGADYAITLKQIEKLPIQAGDIVHLGSLMLSYPRGLNLFNKTVKLAKEKGAIISFDINYRDDIFQDQNIAKRRYKNALKQADILKFSDEEIKLLSGKKTIKAALRKLVTPEQIVVITLGKDGSIFAHGDLFIHVPTKPIKPIDTTGAGDAFYGYFLYALQKDNLKIHIEDTLKHANAVGGLATLKKGAIDVVPSLVELEDFLLN